MRHSDAIAERERSGKKIVLAPLTRKQLLQAAASHFAENANSQYGTLRRIESRLTPLWFLKLKGVEGTAFDAMAKVAADNGTNPAGFRGTVTFGGVMKTYGLDLWQMHNVACNCHHSDFVSGARASEIIQSYADAAT